MKLGPARPRGEEFDPEPAFIYGPETTIRPTGVVETTEKFLFETCIKPPRGMYTNERLNQQAPDSRSTLIIETWNYGPDWDETLGAHLTADMWIVHRGVRYDIVGQLKAVKASWQSETTAYEVRMSNNPC